MPSKVRIKICPGDLLDQEEQGDILLDLDFKEGENLFDILERVRERLNPNFNRFILDSENRRLRGGVLVLRNGRVANLPDGIQTMLHDGDTITLLPVLDGG